MATTARYEDGFDGVELEPSATEALVTLVNADGRASTTVNFTGIFALVAQK